MKYLFLLLLLACSPFEPTGAVAFKPPPTYHVWWQEMESCSGLTGKFNDVSWYYVPGTVIHTPKGDGWGWWDGDHGIFLAEPVYDYTALGIDDGSGTLAHEDMIKAVKHEMLHELVGHSGHSNLFYWCNVIISS